LEKKARHYAAATEEDQVLMPMTAAVDRDQEEDQVLTEPKKLEEQQTLSKKKTWLEPELASNSALAKARVPKALKGS